MGGFSGGGNPLLKMGATAIDAYTGVPVASTALSMAQMKSAQSSQAQAAQQAYDRQAELLRRQQAREIKNRQDLLARATASQRARLGAMGVAGGGSAEALVAGMQQQGAEDIANVSAMYGDRLTSLGWGLSEQLNGIAQAGNNQMLQQLFPFVQSLSGGGERRAGKQQPGTVKNLSLL